MVHLTEMKKSTIYRNVIRPAAQPLLFLQLLVSLIMNVIVFFSMARVFDVDQYKNIPVPGFSNVSSFPKTVDFTDVVGGNLFDAFAFCRFDHFFEQYFHN